MPTIRKHTVHKDGTQGSKVLSASKGAMRKRIQRDKSKIKRLARDGDSDTLATFVDSCKGKKDETHEEVGLC